MIILIWQVFRSMLPSKMQFKQNKHMINLVRNIINLSKVLSI